MDKTDLRCRLAAHALQGILASAGEDVVPADVAAADALDYADAVLKRMGVNTSELVAATQAAMEALQNTLDRRADPLTFPALIARLSKALTEARGC